MYIFLYLYTYIYVYIYIYRRHLRSRSGATRREVGAAHARTQSPCSPCVKSPAGYGEPSRRNGSRCGAVLFTPSPLDA